MSCSNISFNSFIPFELRNDKEYIIGELKKGVKALEWVTKSLRADIDVVIEAVKMNGLELKFASEELRDNYEVVEIAFINDVRSLKYAGAAVQDKLAQKYKKKLSKPTRPKPSSTGSTSINFDNYAWSSPQHANFTMPFIYDSRNDVVQSANIFSFAVNPPALSPALSVLIQQPPLQPIMRYPKYFMDIDIENKMNPLKWTKK